MSMGKSRIVSPSCLQTKDRFNRLHHTPECANKRKYKFFRWKQGRGCWRSRAFFFFDQKQIHLPAGKIWGGRSENVMLSHARLTTTEVPLCEALTPPHLLRWHCSLTSGWSWAIMQLPGVNEGKKKILLPKRTFVQKISPTFYFFPSVGFKPTNTFTFSTAEHFIMILVSKFRFLFTSTLFMTSLTLLSWFSFHL